ncbi:MAG: FAD-binding oxidoreductase [Planctomycetota bacterium]|nr:MAG: FAD-binding oxidoreductase [Planctomycetota bacterium]
MAALPERAKYVIVGGGAVGCGVAYSLAKAGERDIVLLEREPTVAAVTSSQAAGLVGQVRSSVERVKLAMWSVETFSSLQEDEEANPAWRQVGSLRVALNDERVAEFERLKTVADEAGLEVHFIDNDAARQKWPLLNFDAVRAVLWCPSDGYLQPYDLTMAYVAHGRRLGIEICTGTNVRDIVVEDGRVRRVVTDRGEIACDFVINAAGANAYHVARAVGVELPIIPVRHEFFVTVHADGLHPDMPVVRIPDITLYLRPETNALLVGGWEPRSLALDVANYPIDQATPPVESDWEVLGEFGAELSPYIPKVDELGVRSVFKGWPTFAPDGRFIIGESCRVKGFVMAGGCNAHGVSGSAGIGRHVVESILEQQPSEYVRSLSPDRFTETEWDWRTATEEARQLYSNYYAIGH